ncbi:16251_t:CDS:1, partial [Racocetra fulgida]
YIDQNTAIQTNLINKLNEQLDLCFNQLNNKEQTSQPSNTNLQHSNIAPQTHNYEFNLAQSDSHEKNNNTHNTNQQGNCPLTPILNNLIISSNSHGATQEAARTTFTTNGILKVKVTTRRYSSFDYSSNDLSPVCGFNNPHAT